MRTEFAVCSICEAEGEHRPDCLVVRHADLLAAAREVATIYQRAEPDGWTLTECEALDAALRRLAELAGEPTASRSDSSSESPR